jgi:hypothetical protein
MTTTTLPDPAPDGSPDGAPVDRFRVVRRSGLLLPGFTKRISGRHDAGGGPHARSGVTYFLGIRVGAFDVRPAREFGFMDDSERCLRYRSWPIVDVLEQRPSTLGGSIGSAGYLRLPRGRRVRFCTFLLEPCID